MILVTAFDRNKQDIVTVSQSDAHGASKVALDLAVPGRFIRVMDGAWRFVFPATVKVSKDRLAHIIETHADVVLA